MKNVILKPRTANDIDAQVLKVLRGIGNPEPPFPLDNARELLKLDRGYYSSTDDGLLRETISRMKVAGQQVLKRPTVLADAVRALSLKALYLPDQKRILIDRELPALKHRWNEAHEIGHDIIPWHQEMMLGDTDETLKVSCHAQMETEANYAAGRLLFLGDRFVKEARSSPLSLAHIRNLTEVFGNTFTSTMWRYIETADPEQPLVGMISVHPHKARRKPGTDQNPCRYFIQSPAFASRFSRTTEQSVFESISSYCGPQRGGPLGEEEIVLADDRAENHVFFFETFFNRYEALTLGRYLRPNT